MKASNGMDALGMLSDVLFESTGSPVPSFVATGPDVAEPAADSTDIVESAPSWQPAP